MQLIALAHNNSIRIISSTSFATLATITGIPQPVSIAFTNDGAYLVFTCATGIVKLYVYETEGFTRVLGIPDYISKAVWYVAASPTEPLIVVGTSDYYYPGPGIDNMKLDFISTETWEITNTHLIYNSDDRTLSKLVFSPDGTRLGINTSYSPYVAMLLNVETKETIFTPSTSGQTGLDFNLASTKWYVVRYNPGGMILGQPASYVLYEYSATEWSNPTTLFYQATSISRIAFSNYASECVIQRAMPDSTENLLVFSTANWSSLNKGPSKEGITDAIEFKYFDSGRKLLITKTSAPYQVVFDAITWEVDFESEYAISYQLAISPPLDPSISKANDALTLNAQVEVKLSAIARPKDLLHLRGQTVPTGIVQLTALDNVSFSDWLARVVNALAESGFDLSDTSTRTLETLLVLSEIARFNGASVATQETACSIAEQLIVQDLVQLNYNLFAEDTLQLADTLSTALHTWVYGQSAIDLADHIAAMFVVLIEESVILQDGVQPSLSALLHAHDTIAFIGKLILPEGTFSALVMNTDTTGTTHYQQFPFNSLLTHQGRTFGVMEDGLYELIGETDAGESIVASIQTGDIDFGLSKDKNIPRAYLILHTDGKMVFKTISSLRGVRTTRYYELTPNAGNDEAVRRIVLARTLRGVTWGFQLTNVSGADFNFSGAEVIPIILSRRGN